MFVETCWNESRCEEEIERKDDQLIQREKEWTKKVETLEKRLCGEREPRLSDERTPTWQRNLNDSYGHENQNPISSQRVQKGIPTAPGTNSARFKSGDAFWEEERAPFDSIENKAEKATMKLNTECFMKYKEADFEELRKKVKELGGKVEKLADENSNLKAKVKYYQSNGRIGRENPKGLSLCESASKRLNYSSLNDWSGSPQNRSTAHWKENSDSLLAKEEFTLRGKEDESGKEGQIERETAKGRLTIRNLETVGDNEDARMNAGRFCEALGAGDQRNREQCVSRERKRNDFDSLGLNSEQEERKNTRSRSRSRSASRLLKLLQSIESADESSSQMNERSLLKSRDLGGSMTRAKESLFNFTNPLNGSSGNEQTASSTKSKILSLKNNKEMLEKKLQDFERRLKSIE